MSSRSDGTPASPSLDDGTAGVSASVDAAIVEGASVEAPFSWRKFLWTTWPLTLIGILVAFGVPLCPSRNFLGIPCPGCGLTRATEAMVVGDFAAMLRYHPLAPIITPVVLFSVARVTLISAGVLRPDIGDPLGRLPRWFWGILAFVLVGLWSSRLAGFFGGLPDPVDMTNGWFYIALRFVFYDMWVWMGVLG